MAFISIHTPIIYKHGWIYWATSPQTRLLGASNAWLFVRHLSDFKGRGDMEGTLRVTGFMSTAPIHINSYPPYTMCKYWTKHFKSLVGKVEVFSTQRMIWGPFRTTFLAWINICRATSTSLICLYDFAGKWLKTSSQWGEILKMPKSTFSTFF